MLDQGGQRDQCGHGLYQGTTRRKRTTVALPLSALRNLRTCILRLQGLLNSSLLSEIHVVRVSGILSVICHVVVG